LREHSSELMQHHNFWLTQESEASQIGIPSTVPNLDASFPNQSKIVV